MLGWISSEGEVHLLAEIGIAVLLFVVGLKLDVNLVRQLGPVALAAGIGQMALTAGLGFGLAMLLGLVMPTSGEVRVFGADMARNRYQVAQRINFQSPYVDLPMRLTVRQNLTVYAGLYGVANEAERIAFLAEDLQIEENRAVWSGVP